MALINCNSCGREISDQRKKCIHCGYSTKKSKYSFLINNEYFFSTILFVVYFICLLTIIFLGFSIKYSILLTCLFSIISILIYIKKRISFKRCITNILSFVLIELIFIYPLFIPLLLLIYIFARNIFKL